MPKPGAWAMHVTVHSEADANATYTNMAAADSFLFGSVRHVQLIDILGMSQVRLKVNKQATAGAASATLRVAYALTYSTSVASYLDISSPSCEVAINVANQYLDSGWQTITPDAFAGGGDIYLAIIGSGGDGVLDPAFGSVSVAFQ